MLRDSNDSFDLDLANRFRSEPAPLEILDVFFYQIVYVADSSLRQIPEMMRNQDLIFDE